MITLAATSLTLIGAGCNNQQHTAYATYTVGIYTSMEHQETRNVALAASETTVSTLLDEAGIQAETASRGSEEAITKLNGIISTLSSEWHLYINNTLQVFTHLDRVPVRASDTIQLKYEHPLSTEQQ